MNKNRRAEIQAVIDDLENIKQRIEQIRDDEQDYRDRMPDNLFDSQRAQQSDAAIADLDCAVDEIDSSMTSLQSAIEN